MKADQDSGESQRLAICMSPKRRISFTDILKYGSQPDRFSKSKAKRQDPVIPLRRKRL